MKFLLIIYLAGAAHPDARHPDAGFYPSQEVCVAKMQKARAEGHIAKCMDLDTSKYRLKGRDSRLKVRLYIYPKDSYWDDELRTSDYYDMEECERLALAARRHGHIAHCRSPWKSPGPCADCGRKPEFPPA